MSLALSEASGSYPTGRGLQITPCDAALGVQITGVDLRRVDDATFKIIHEAWLDNIVLICRGQEFTDEELVRFARRFGTLELSPSKHERASHQVHDGPPEITVVSNVKQNGVPIGELGDGEVVWHSDYAHRDVPAGARMLFAREIPPARLGGNTCFLNAYAAFDTLSDEMKQRLSGKTFKPDTTLDANLNLRLGAKPASDIREAPGPRHPIISTHPETGCNSLFLGRREKAYINGLALEESEVLLDQLWAHLTQRQFVYEHQWALGDLVIWDNRCALHRRGPFDGDSRRIMHAAQVVGHRPVEAPDALTRAPHPRYAKSRH